jgi:TolA-binding protein
MSWNDHDHRGEYAGERHDHDNDYAPLHHRHYDLEREDERLQGLLREIDSQVGQLRRELEDALGRIRQLEAGHEADVREAAEAEAWGGRGPSASYEEWLAEGRQEEDR